jgi:hypothetical protein
MATFIAFLNRVPAASDHDNEILRTAIRLFIRLAKKTISQTKQFPPAIRYSDGFGN